MAECDNWRQVTWRSHVSGDIAIKRREHATRFPSPATLSVFLHRRSPSAVSLSLSLSFNLFNHFLHYILTQTLIFPSHPFLFLIQSFHLFLNPTPNLVSPAFWSSGWSSALVSGILTIWSLYVFGFLFDSLKFQSLYAEDWFVLKEN